MGKHHLMPHLHQVRNHLHGLPDRFHLFCQGGTRAFPPRATTIRFFIPPPSLQYVWQHCVKCSTCHKVIYPGCLIGLVAGFHIPRPHDDGRDVMASAERHRIGGIYAGTRNQVLSVQLLKGIPGGYHQSLSSSVFHVGKYSSCVSRFLCTLLSIVGIYTLYGALPGFVM